MKPARRAFNQRFLDQVDPDRHLPDRERQRRAEAARRAYFTRLAYLSARSRRHARRSASPQGVRAGPGERK